MAGNAAQVDQEVVFGEASILQVRHVQLQPRQRVGQLLFLSRDWCEPPDEQGSPCTGSASMPCTP